MTDPPDDRVADVLDAASTESGTLLTSAEDSDDAGENLLDAADEAADLVESMEPPELLEAVGLGSLDDGSEPETVSEAITESDPDRVDDLRRLLRLAELSDQSDADELEDATGGIREAIERTRTEDDETMTEDEESDHADESDDDAEEEQASTDDEKTDDEETDGEGESSDLGNRLREAMSSSFEEFGDDLGALEERLEEAASGDEDEDGGEGEEGDADDDGLLGIGDDEEGDEDEASEDEADDEEDDENNEGDEDDDGLLGIGDGDDGGGLGSSDSSRHSTMAPPPSERADMNAVKRHSTMPKKNR
jgi:hypothetical protein